MNILSKEVNNARENKIYLLIFDPIKLYIKTKVVYYDKLEYDFITDYCLNNNIKPVNIMEGYEMMVKSENPEYIKISCELYKWLCLDGDKVSKDLLLIIREKMTK